MKDVTKQLLQTSWKTSMSSVQQATKAAFLPVAGLLTRSNSESGQAERANQRVDEAFDRMIDCGNEFQSQAIDLSFDLATLQIFKPSVSAAQHHPILSEFVFDRVPDPGGDTGSLKMALGGRNSVVFPPLGPAGGDIVKNDTDFDVSFFRIEILAPGDPRVPEGFSQPNVRWGDVDHDGQAAHSNVFRRIVVGCEGRTLTFDQGTISRGEFFQGMLGAHTMPVHVVAQATFSDRAI